MTHVLALDQGTTSSRAIVFRADGSIAGVARRDLPQHFPRPGWVEHDAEVIWTGQRETIVEALRAAAVDRGDVAAVGITNQRETTVVWDRATGDPIHHAIVWQDRRTTEACERLRADGVEPLIAARTGLLLDPYFSATKIAWILDHVPDARARAERGELACGTIDAWLVHRLTGGRVHATDASNASRTMLFDLETGDWDDELLALLRVPRALMPTVVPTAGVVAEISAIAELDGVPIASLVGDQQAATVGQLCVDPGMAKNTYGTGCFLLMNIGETPRASENRLLTTVGWRHGDRTTFCLEGGVFVGGALVQWLRDGLGIIDAAPDVEPLARSVPDSGGVVLVPALAGLGAPHWDPHARGTIFGITRGTTAAHVARAALEGIAFEVADLVETMGRDAGVALSTLRVDGGASANDLLMQIQADLLGVPIERPVMLETTVAGAAMLARLGIGDVRRLEEFATRRSVDRRFEPTIADAEIARRRARWHDAVGRSRGWARETD